MPFNAEEVIAEANAALEKRRQWEGLWKECLFFTQPSKYILAETKGAKLPADLYDSTGINSLNTFASGINGNMTNQSTVWYEYESVDEDDMQDEEIAQYFSKCTKVCRDILNASNFYQKAQQVYKTLGNIGSPVLYAEEDPKTVARFYTIGHLDAAIGEDDTERVDTVYRWRKYTARQAYKKWGKKAGATALKLIQDKKQEEIVEYLHAVTPRYQRKAGKTDNKNMPWASLWISIADKQIVAESGYPEFPFFVPRWDKDETSPYSYCPASHALADMKTLNDMDGTIIQGAKVAVKPPLVIPHDGYVLPITQKAGGLNYKLSGVNGEKIETLSNGGNIPVGMDFTADRRRRVEQAFYVDLFKRFTYDPNDPTKTATEINMINNQNMLLLGPSIGNILTDLLSPCMIRVYMIAGRAGKLPPLPEKLKGKEFTVKFTSQLARAQKMAELNGINNTMNMASAILGFNPESGDVLDFDEALREIATINGNNPKLTRDVKAVDARRAERMKAQQQQAQMEAMMQMAQMVKTGAEAGATYQKSQQPAGAAK